MNKFRYSSVELRRAKDEIRQILITKAKEGGTIIYSDLVSKVLSINLEPHSPILASLLGDISEEENEHGRGMLSVIVVHKYGDMKPGPGFFELAKSLGRDTSNILKCWINELNKVYGNWNDY